MKDKQLRCLLYARHEKRMGRICFSAVCWPGDLVRLNRRLLC